MEQEPEHRQKQHQPLADQAGSSQSLTPGSLFFSPIVFFYPNHCASIT